MTSPIPLSTDDLALFFEPRHHQLAETIRAGAAQVFAASDTQVVPALATHGLLAPLFADTFDVRALCLVREALAYGSPVADAIFAVHGLGSFPLRGRSFTEVIAQAAAGSHVCAFALTEPEAGSDVGSLRCRAERSSDGYVLRGVKTFISNAGIAHSYIVFARTSEAKRGISAFFVPADSVGLSIRPLELSAPHPIGELHFDGVIVPHAHRLGEEGDGMGIALSTLDTFRVSVGAAAVGMARRAWAETLKHVKARKQFGAPLADLAVVQSQLADMACDIDSARLLVLRAAYSKDTGAAHASQHVAMAKLMATEAAQRVIDRAVQLHGGRGVLAGEIVEHLYRAIRPLRIYEGTSEIQKLIIGRGLVA